MYYKSQYPQSPVSGSKLQDSCECVRLDQQLFRNRTSTFAPHTNRNVFEGMIRDPGGQRSDTRYLSRIAGPMIKFHSFGI